MKLLSHRGVYVNCNAIILLWWEQRTCCSENRLFACLCIKGTHNRETLYVCLPSSHAFLPPKILHGLSWKCCIRALHQNLAIFLFVSIKQPTSDRRNILLSSYLKRKVNYFGVRIPQWETAVKEIDPFKMGPIRCPETSVASCPLTMRSTPKDRIPQLTTRVSFFFFYWLLQPTCGF
jgi:hypothetical protein